MIEFDEAKHEYSKGGTIYPSVTTILQDVGLVDITYFTEESAMRGTYVHDCLKLLDENVPLVMMDIGEDIEGYINAYLKFKKENDYKIIESETHHINETMRFAGTPDRVCTLNGKDAIIDIKTGAKCDWHCIQLSGYKLLVNDAKLLLYGLYLKDTGIYRLEPYKDADYRNVFYAALTVYGFKHK